MRTQINVASRQVIQRPIKLKNTPTYFTHTVMQIMQDIYLTGALSPQNLNSSMALRYTGVQLINPRNPKVVPMQKIRSMYKGALYQNWI